MTIRRERGARSTSFVAVSALPSGLLFLALKAIVRDSVGFWMRKVAERRRV